MELGDVIFGISATKYAVGYSLAVKLVRICFNEIEGDGACGLCTISKRVADFESGGLLLLFCIWFGDLLHHFVIGRVRAVNSCGRAFYRG